MTNFLSKEEIRIERLKRKIDRYKRVIEGQEKRIAKLEHTNAFVLETLPKNIESAVTNALCNVRMIPVSHSLKTSKIVEINIKDKKYE